jgi:hypothetical protein
VVDVSSGLGLTPPQETKKLRAKELVNRIIVSSLLRYDLGKL